ncbi:hypothetical protein GGI26_004245 [Coemansia sp. RSA 1358]|nr:hypothetical protein GGI26_004245 [Coemansia sp. RSA 1358]
MVSVSVNRLVACLALFTTALGQASELFKRDVSVSNVLAFKSALLLVGSQETSCEAALIDSSSAFVAATCLQDSNGKIDTSAQYRLAIKMGKGDSPTVTKTISSITVHPKYDSSTLINNLAVVQFDKDQTIGWQNYFGINPTEWSSLYYVRRSLKNVPALTWSNVTAYSSMDTPGKCATSSPAYQANTADFLCNYAGVLSIFNPECKVPYGTVFAAIDPNDMALVAIHSHTAVIGNSMCSTQTKLHYYTLLRNYLAWGAKVIGRPIGGFTLNSSYSFTPNTGYTMKSVSSNSVSGIAVFDGNRYADDPDASSLSQAIYSNSGTTLTSAGGTGSGPTPTIGSSGTNTNDSGSNSNPTPTSGTKHASSSSSIINISTTELSDLDSASDPDSDSSSDDSSDSSSSGSSSKGKVSPIAIVVPVILVLLIAGGLIYWFVRRRRKMMMEQEQEQSQHQQNGWTREDDNVTSLHQPEDPNDPRFNSYYNTTNVAPTTPYAGNPQSHMFAQQNYYRDANDFRGNL